MLNEKIVEAVAEAIKAADPCCDDNWDYRDEARAAITADQAAAWQPIETAPKDGSEIILGCAGKNGWSGAGFYHDGSQCKRSDGGWFGEDDRNNLLIAKDIDVTHWMPLPPPPKEA